MEGPQGPNFTPKIPIVIVGDPKDPGPDGGEQDAIPEVKIGRPEVEPEYDIDWDVPTSFDSMDEFMHFVDRDGDGVISDEEMLEAKEMFKDAGIEELTIDGKKYNMVYENLNKKGEQKKAWLGQGRNLIKGTDGNDIIWGTAGDDKIKGGKGDDIIFGGGGSDKIKGQKGDDIIIANEYKKVKGGKGEDTHYAFGGKTKSNNIEHTESRFEPTVPEYESLEDFIAEFDTDGDGRLSPLELNAAQRHFDQMNAKEIKIGNETYNLITAVDTEKVQGTNDKDFIIAAGVDTIDAGSGDDIVLAADFGELFAGEGNDTVIGQQGTAVYGGAGDDTINLFNVEETHGGAGDDNITVDTGKLVMGNDGNDTINVKNIEGHTHGGFGDDYINAENTGSIFGDDGDDYIVAKDVDGDIYAHYGNDVVRADGVTGNVSGGTGDDVLDVKNVDGMVDANTGDDTIYTDGKESRLLDGEGNDIVNGEVENPTNDTYSQERLDNFYTMIKDQYGELVLEQAKSMLENGWPMARIIQFLQQTIHPITGEPLTPENQFDIDS